MANPEESLDPVSRAIRAAVDRRPRMLTPGGSRVWPDKKLMELSAVRDLVAGLQKRGEPSLVDVRPRTETRPQTSPDVLAKNEGGGLVGIEVAELADQEVIELNLPLSQARFEAMDGATTHEERKNAFLAHPEKVRIWSGREVLDAIAEIVAKKDARAFATDGELYAERWLVIHTAEPFVAWGEFALELTRRTFTPKQFTSVYLVRDFDPVTRGYPSWRVHPH